MLNRFHARGTDGIGIGLYLAREITTMQGGYVKFEPYNVPVNQRKAVFV